MPKQNQLHVDKLLSNISVKYKVEGGIAMDVFPEVPVTNISDKYRVYNRNLRLPETARRSGGEAKEHDFDVSTASYLLERHSLKGFVSDSDADNYDIADLRADMTEELTDVIMRRLELKVAQLFTTTSWSLNVSLAAANAFNANTTVSNPVPIYLTGSATVIANGAPKPNFGILPLDAKNACVVHTSILDRLKYTTAEVDTKKLAALFDLEELLVPGAAYDTSALGVADTTTNIANFYGDIAFMGYKPKKAGPLKASAGYVFRKKLPLTKRWRVEERESDCIEVNLEFQPKVVASLAGYLIKDVI